MSMLKTLMSLAVIAMLVELVMAANYTVGAPNGGWDTSSDLKTWTSTKSFFVGDNLLFTYSPSHDVVEVPKADYDSCQPNNPIQTYNGGSTVIPLVSSGKRYFICGIPGHCSAGMKVEIDTLAASAPPPATPATPPTTPVTPPAATPAMPPAATPMNPPSSTPATPPMASSPKSAPTMPPSKSPLSSPKSAPTMSPPSKKPVSSPESSPTFPSSESPTSSMPPNGSLPPPPPSSASKINIWVGFTVGLGFVMSMLLNL